MVDIESIYKKSFEIVKKNKWLWVFGMALVAFTGGGGGSSFRGAGDFAQYFNKSKDSSLPDTIKAADPVFEYFKNLFFSIPPSLYISLAIGIFVLIIVGLVISVVVSSWAKGAAIGAINDAYDGKPVTLRNGSEYGIRNLKNMVWLTVVPWLLYFLILVGCFTVLFIPVFIFKESPIILISVLLMLLVGIAAVVASLGISATQIWAQRVVVIEGKSGKEAFKEGWQLTRKHLGDMAVLGCTNCLLGCCLGAVAIGAIGGLIFSGIGLMALNKNAGIIFLFIVGILVLALILISTLLAGVYKIFNYTTWNVLYRQIREEKVNGK